ncbi:hypothetical protein C171_32341 [Paenibacillus sp. FSL H8-237]|nr:hypothetical protein C171_32341 [Paenibacillus sp. FSL H8-237]
MVRNMSNSPSNMLMGDEEIKIYLGYYRFVWGVEINYRRFFVSCKLSMERKVGALDFINKKCMRFHCRKRSVMLSF